MRCSRELGEIIRRDFDRREFRVGQRVEFETYKGRLEGTISGYVSSNSAMREITTDTGEKWQSLCANIFLQNLTT